MTEEKLRLWHYNNFKTFNNMVFGKCFTEANFKGKTRSIQQQEVFYKINNEGELSEWSPMKEGVVDRESTFYTKMIKDDFNYIVPRKFLDKLPFVVMEYIEIRLKRYDTNIWRFVTKIKSMTVPEEKTMSFRSYVDQFNPVSHSDSKAWTFMKLFSFANCNIGLCGSYALGKNANLTLRSNMTGRVAAKVKEPTKAVFWQTLKYNDRVNIDEINSWSKTTVGLIEEDLVDLADDSPDTTKHSLNASGKLGVMDLTSKSVSFTFNPVSKDNPNSFSSRFSNSGKVLDRYPVLFVTGRVLSSIPKPTRAMSEANVGANLEWYKMQVKNLAYFLNNISKELHHYDRSSNPFKGNNRHVSNTVGLLDVLDAYCDSQEEFDGWLRWLGERQRAYVVGEDNSIVVSEEFVK